MRLIVIAASIVLVIAGCGSGAAPAGQPESISRSTESAAEPKSEIPGDGTFAVGTDIAPGTWKSAGPQNGQQCRWQRVSSVDGADIADNTDPGGPQTVQILSGDKSFQTTGCQTWRKIG